MEKHTMPVTALSPSVDPGQLGFVDTGELPPLDETIGQDRAVEALEFGLRIPSAGFNIDSISMSLDRLGPEKPRLSKTWWCGWPKAKESPTPPDWCYVNNFRDSSKPRCLAFPATQGRAFERAMDGFIAALRRDIPTAFESTKYLEAKAAARIEEMEAKKKALFKEFTEHCRAHGFILEEAPMGFTIVPLHAGSPSPSRNSPNYRRKSNASSPSAKRRLKAASGKFGSEFTRSIMRPSDMSVNWIVRSS